MGRYDQFSNELAQAIRAHTSLPEFPQGMSLEEAYELLPQVASSVCDQQIVGMKAGLTDPDLARLFGLEEPLLGLLYDWGECQPGSVLAYREHSQIECELVIRLGDQGRPVAIGPAIEIVCLNFSSPEDFNAPNLVACSLGADRFVCGQQIPWDQVDFDSLQEVSIKLWREGDLLLEASPFDSLDGPEHALSWCLAEADRRSIQVVDNAILLTGTCGSAVPLGEGAFVADYGSLGRVQFRVECVDSP